MNLFHVICRHYSSIYVTNTCHFPLLSFVTFEGLSIILMAWKLKAIESKEDIGNGAVITGATLNFVRGANLEDEKEAEEKPLVDEEELPQARSGRKRGGPAVAGSSRPKDSKTSSSATPGVDSKREKRMHAKVATMKLSKDHQSLLTLMLKGQLWTMQNMREVLGVIYDQWIVEADSPEAEEMRGQGRSYSEEVKKRGRGHGLGCPAIHIAGGFFGALEKRGPMIGLKNQKHLKWIVELMDNSSPQEFFLLVRQCRVHKVYDKTKARISIALREDMLQSWKQQSIETLRAEAKEDQEKAQLLVDRESLLMLSLRSSLLSAMEQLSARFLTGRPPMGAMEELLQAALP